MTEYHQTCGLTNLPIKEGEAVTVLVLARRNPSYHPFHLYSTNVTEFVTPLFLPISGNYDGKGGLKQIEIDPLSEQYLRSLNMIPAGKILPEPKATIEERLYELTQPGVTIKKDGIALPPLYLSFYHKQAFDLVVSSIGNRIPVFQTLSYRTLLEQKIMTKMTQTMTDFDIKGEIRFREDFFFSPYDVTAFCIPYLEYLYDTAQHNKVSLEQKTFEQRTFQQRLTTLLCFLKGFEFLRKGFGCITGAQTDQYELSLHKTLAEFTLQFYQKQKELQDFTDSKNNNTWAQETLYWYPEATSRAKKNKEKRNERSQ